MPADLEILVAARHAPKRSKAIAAYRAHVTQARPEWKPGPPVTAPPARRCETCGERACWVWEELRPGAGEWTAGCIE